MEPSQPRRREFAELYYSSGRRATLSLLPQQKQTQQSHSPHDHPRGSQQVEHDKHVQHFCSNQSCKCGGQNISHVQDEIKSATTYRLYVRIPGGIL